MEVTETAVGADIGGTFTDLVAAEGGELRVYKLPSTPESPEEALFRGLQEGGMEEASRIAHGSTVAVNALLERKGTRTAFVATEGFSDLLAIGRQTRPRLYDLAVEKIAPLVPPELCFEVAERVSSRGEVIVPLREEEVEGLSRRMEGLGVEAVAVCLLFSFLHPRHEELVGRVLSERGMVVHLSSRILPEYREYERASTVVVNAYVSGKVSRYLSVLEEGLSGKRLEIMHSGGGTMEPAEARLIPARTLMSGPAGGVVATAKLASLAGHPRAVALDMGGTSTDVSLVDGGISLSAEGSVAGYPVRFPMIDIHSIGAGGGSLAKVDRGGALKVGPESAGAHPGPACYGIGRLPTVTDAHVVLGRLREEYFLGGRMRLFPGRSLEAMRDLGRNLGCSAREAAAGVLSVVLNNMARAVRLMTVDRGHDPSLFTLVAYGGAGPMHGCELAELLGIRRVLVPPWPGAFSACGLLLADRVRDSSLTLMLPMSPEAMDRAREAWGRMGEGLPPSWKEVEDVAHLPAMDLRYRGQGYELRVEVERDWDFRRVIELFHRAHRRRYGFHLEDGEVEVVNVRLRSVLPSNADFPRPTRTGLSGKKGVGSAKMAFVLPDGRLWEEECAVLSRTWLRSGEVFDGPCLVCEEDATAVVPPGWRGRVDERGCLLLERRGSG